MRACNIVRTLQGLCTCGTRDLHVRTAANIVVCIAKYIKLVMDCVTVTFVLLSIQLIIIFSYILLAAVYSSWPPD